MPVKLNSFWEGFIFGLSRSGMSYSTILKVCKEDGLNISKAGIGKVILRTRQQIQIQHENLEKRSRNKPQPGRTKDVVSKIRLMASSENPPTQKIMAKKINKSQSTVHRIIHQNLALKKCFKAKVHRLNDRQIRERRIHCRKLYEKFLAGDKWQWIVSLDEAWIYLDDTNKPRSIFYRKKSEKGRGEFLRKCREKFSKGFMVVAGYCAMGQLTIHRVSSKAKINAQYFQTNVLEPIYNSDIPRLYGNQASKVLIHMDKASSHTARSSVAYYERKFEETGIKVIPFSHVPVKSPDCSPMDFCGFGLLKRGLSSRRPTTVEGLWKVCQEVWYDIPLVTLRKSLMQWKLRCRAIVKANGKYIEHNRWWKRGIK